MKAVKYLFSIILAIALIVGVVIFAMREMEDNQSSPDTVSSPVVINEFMASNNGYLPDEKGSYSDWIELYNPTESAVNLAGLALSDDKTQARWLLPDVMLPAGGYMLVFASGEDARDPSMPLHAGFRLGASGGGVYLMTAEGQLLDAVEYGYQAGNMSLGRDVQDLAAWKEFDKPTPGFANDDAGYAAFIESRKAKDSLLMITEVMASNKTTLADNTGAYSDYVEIYNAGSEALNLKGYGLSDDPTDVLGWRFPDVMIEPGAYLYVFASGLDAQNTDAERSAFHTNFRISSYRETIVLSDANGFVIDEVTVAELDADRAYARVLDDSGVYRDDWQVTDQPTPGYANNDSGYKQFRENNP